MEDEDYVKLDPSKNPAQTFGILVKKLETISKDTGTSIEKVLDDYIIDLKNYFNEGYKNKVDCIEVKGLDPVIVNNFISYIRKVKLGYKKREQENKRKEKQAAKIELKQIKKQEMETTYNNIVASINEGVESGIQGSEIEILQRVISDINNDESEYNIGKDIKKDILGKLKERLQKATKEETNRRNAEKVMGQIEEIVEREYQEGNVKNKANYLSAIKEAIENKDSNFDIKVDKDSKEQLLSIIDERINTEKEQMYYNQVKRFTRDFSFLMEYPEMIRAKGLKITKFTDKESYQRYVALRSLLKRGRDEYNQVNKLLMSDEVDSTSKRILAMRKSVMDKELEDMNQR